MLHNERLSKLTQAPFVRIHPSRGIEDGKEVVIKAGGNSLKAKVKWDLGVALDTVVIPIGYKNLPVHELSPQLINGIEVGIE
jgi:NADH-quinone oxidoreductase subunit G